MMKIFTLFFSFFLLGGLNLQAQLANGGLAPDFTITDIDGNTHHLYEYLEDGKIVIVDFFASWSGPCWNYMQGGALQEVYENLGPNGTDEVVMPH